MKEYIIPTTDVLEISTLSNIMLQSPTDLQAGGDTSNALNPWHAPGKKPF
jgi:hypothetical protein